MPENAHTQRKKTSKKRKLLTFLLKLSFSFLLIILVLKELDIQKFVKQLTSANPLYVSLGIASVILGQIFGGFRMRYYANSMDMPLSKLYSMCFYFIGTLFNIVLPGGIGGDGYKAYYFQKRFRYPWGKTIITVLRGRASGLLILCLQLCIFGMIYSDSIKIPHAFELFLVGIIIVIPCYSFLAKKLLKESVSVQVSAAKYSIVVQLFYLLAIIFILYSLGAFKNVLGYILVFLISNIVAVIPISFGGLGLREFTFINLSALMHLQVDIGVAASMLFYLMYSFVSLIGFFPYIFLDKLDKRELAYLKTLEPLKEQGQENTPQN